MWNSNSAAALSRFLRENPEFIPELLSRAPEIITDKGMETGALTGAAHSGAEHITREIESMAVPMADEAKSPFIS